MTKKGFSIPNLDGRHKHQKRNGIMVLSRITTFVLVLSFALILTTDCTIITVNEQYMNGWYFAWDVPDGINDTFVVGPDTPPLGIGSMNIRLSSSLPGIQVFATQQFAGLMLANLELAYFYAYVLAGSVAQCYMSFQFDVHMDMIAPVTGDEGRLVLMWTQQQVSQLLGYNTWQRWNISDGGSLWYFTPQNPYSSQCTIESPCTKDQLISTYPRIGVRPGDGSVLFKPDGICSGAFSGFVDDFAVLVNGSELIAFNFDPSLSSSSLTSSPGYSFFANPSFNNLFPNLSPSIHNSRNVLLHVVLSQIVTSVLIIRLLLS